MVQYSVHRESHFGKSSRIDRLKIATLLTIVLLFAPAALCRSEELLVLLPIEEVMNNLEVSSKLDKSIRLFWENQEFGEPEITFGEYEVNWEINAIGKKQDEACQLALISCLKELQARAAKEGGNAIVSIKSSLEVPERTGGTHYFCLAGTTLVKVALHGTVVKLVDK